MNDDNRFSVDWDALDDILEAEYRRTQERLNTKTQSSSAQPSTVPSTTPTTQPSATVPQQPVQQPTQQTPQQPAQQPAQQPVQQPAQQPVQQAPPPPPEDKTKKVKSPPQAPAKLPTIEEINKRMQGLPDDKKIKMLDKLIQDAQNLVNKAGQELNPWIQINDPAIARLFGLIDTSDTTQDPIQARAGTLLQHAVDRGMGEELTALSAQLGITPQEVLALQHLAGPDFRGFLDKPTYQIQPADPVLAKQQQLNMLYKALEQAEAIRQGKNNPIVALAESIIANSPQIFPATLQRFEQPIPNNISTVTPIPMPLPPAPPVLPISPPRNVPPTLQQQNE